MGVPFHNFDKQKYYTTDHTVPNPDYMPDVVDEIGPNPFYDDHFVKKMNNLVKKKSYAEEVAKNKEVKEKLKELLGKEAMVAEEKSPIKFPSTLTVTSTELRQLIMVLVKKLGGEASVTNEDIENCQIGAYLNFDRIRNPDNGEEQLILKVQDANGKAQKKKKKEVKKVEEDHGPLGKRAIPYKIIIKK